MLGAVIIAVAYLSLNTFQDPVIAIAPPQTIELPTKKPERDPNPIERVHILNPMAERHEATQSVAGGSNDGGAAATYDDLRRELLTGE